MGIDDDEVDDIGRVAATRYMERHNIHYAKLSSAADAKLHNGLLRLAKCRNYRDAWLMRGFIPGAV